MVGNRTVIMQVNDLKCESADQKRLLQLWDSAGSERYRAISNQYMRKADAVVLVYDVCCEKSFLNVRDWIESIRNGVDDGCVIALVANKLDLANSNENSRIITQAHGAQLARVRFLFAFFPPYCFKL